MRNMRVREEAARLEHQGAVILFHPHRMRGSTQGAVRLRDEAVPLEEYESLALEREDYMPNGT